MISYCSCSENIVDRHIYVSGFNVHEEIFQHSCDLLVHLTLLEDRGRNSFFTAPRLRQ